MDNSGNIKFKVSVVSDEKSAASLTGLLSEGFRISQTNEFDSGVVYILVLEEAPKLPEFAPKKKLS